MRRLVSVVRTTCAKSKRLAQRLIGRKNVPLGPYFVILGVKRSGSNLLESTLAQFPDLVCYGEVFNKGHPKDPNDPRLLGWTKGQRNADPLGFLEELITATPEQIPGFRLLFDAHLPAVFERVISDHNCTRIVLRRNPLESYISLKLAKATRQWLVKGSAELKSAKVRFDACEFEIYRERVEAFYTKICRQMQAAGTTAGYIDYTALKTPKTIYGLARMIGAKSFPARLRELIVRQNPGPIEAKLENPADFTAWLQTHECETLSPDPDVEVGEPNQMVGVQRVIAEQKPN